MINRTTLRKRMKLWQSFSNRDMKRDVFATLLREDIENGNKIFSIIEKDVKTEKRFRKLLSPGSLNELSDVIIGYNMSTTIEVLLNITEKILMFECAAINKYILLRGKYERYLFSNNYKQCKEILGEIENTVGFSIWGCSQRFLVEELENGLEANKKLLGKYTEEIGKNLLINTLLDFYSYSSEKNTSYFNYKDKINKYLESLDESVVVPYLRFKLDYNAACSRDIIGIVLQIDSQISVVDLYNSFVEILQHNSYYNYFGNKNIVVNIEKYIDDYRLHNLMIFYGVYDKFDDYLDKHNSVYKIIEKYTVGAYDEVIEMSMNYIKSKPEDFQMRHFLAKAVINSKRKMEIEAIALDDIFNIYSLNSKFSESILNLYNMLKLYQGTSWKYKIRGFICRKQAVTDNCLDVFVSHISDCVITPNYVGYISDKENFLKSFYNYCPNTAELFLYLSGVKTELSESLSLDFIRKNVYISAREIGDGENEEAIRHLKSALSVVNNTDFYNMERVGRKLFVAYKNLKLWKELIDLTVTFFMKNPNLCKRFKLGECIDSIKRCKDVEVRGNIKTPIFMYIYDKNDYKLQRIAYANYIDKNNIKNVTDLCQTAQEKEEIVFFLFRICCMNVLKRDIRLAKNTDEVEKVRIDILRNLMALDEKNKKTYYDEINKIMLKRSIRDKIKQFNQSRIYVDTEKIGDEYYEIFKENYDKYMLLKSFDEKLSMLDITSEKYLDDLKKIMENINTRLKQDVNYSQEVVVLKDLISRIADQFLFNEKYGLNTFLSSRIRHGYCQNKLLTIFYDYHLTSKSLENTSSNYNVNEYWDEKVINKGQTYEMFKEILSNFTLKIDTKVNQIKKEWLRIKNHENEEGLFDFRDFVKNCVLVITSNDEMIQDYEIFYQSIIDLFWIYTEKNLVIVREKIKNDLKKYFWECINELENSIAPLEKTSLKSVFIEMKNNINICKTKIDTVIQEFSDVFYKRDISYCDYTMRDMFVTCLEISQRLSGEFKTVSIISKIECDYTFSGESFPYFVDILNMMINNAVEHSGFQKSSDIKVEITIEDNNSICENYIDIVEAQIPGKNFKDYVVIKVKNNLDKSIDEKKLLKKIQEIFFNAKNPEILRKYTQLEGGSGLYKIYKTLQYNIMAPYSILYNIENSQFELIILIEINDLIIL